MVKVWKKRWFILNGGVLFYFKDEKVQKPRKKKKKKKSFLSWNSKKKIILKDDTVLGAIMLKNAELKEGGKILRKKNTLCILDEVKYNIFWIIFMVIFFSPQK